MFVHLFVRTLLVVYAVEFTRINHENLSLRFWRPELPEVYLSADPVLQKDSFFALF